MFMTYPLKLRQKVFSTKDKFGLTFQETSESFDILLFFYKIEHTKSSSVVSLGINCLRFFKVPKIFSIGLKSGEYGGVLPRFHGQFS